MVSARAEAQLVPVTYESRFTLSLPPSWDVQYDQGFMRLVASPSTWSSVFRPNLNVVISATDFEDLDTYDEHDVNAMNVQVPDIAWHERLDIMANGRPAKQRSYTASFQGQTVRGLQVVVLHAGRSYTVTCTATPEGFDDFAPQCLEVALTLAPG